jgi:large subunit ribosomal protein L13
MRKTYTIDAKNQVLGKLAAQIAIILRGKNSPDFAPNKDADIVVNIENSDKIKFTGKKFEKKIYYHHTGYLGGLKSATLKEVFKKDHRKVLRAAVWGMLPTNKLRSRQIRRLKIK